MVPKGWYLLEDRGVQQEDGKMKFVGQGLQPTESNEDSWRRHMPKGTPN